MRDVFRPPGPAWQRVSPLLLRARLITLALVMVPVTIAAVVVVALSTDGLTWVLVAVAGGLVLSGWIAVLTARRVRAYGYAEREDDLLVTSGVLLRRLVIVPYGRLQLVDLTAGPIDRALGITTVQLHTAAATSDASIPGLLPADAAALRDRLVALGEQRTAGL
jgi:membrane protein YdbS with pleckstrin-like domain